MFGEPAFDDVGNLGEGVGLIVVADARHPPAIVATIDVDGLIEVEARQLADFIHARWRRVFTTGYYVPQQTKGTNIARAIIIGATALPMPFPPQRGYWTVAKDSSIPRKA